MRVPLSLRGPVRKRDSLRAVLFVFIKENYV
nr:MAG TPA: hypothetical protein [Caudoviricetes sp.]DAN13447.1 MAG TPA: hypothetical protein [Caudoviricetes sp.]DAX18509.1 MAG TPA: hypothetical protein [Caudoviricetes sp.]